MSGNDNNNNVEYLPVIKFYVPNDSGINNDSEIITLCDGFYIKPLQDGSKVKDSKVFIVKGCRFKDSRTAIEKSIKMDIALRLSSLDTSIGIKTKNNNPESCCIATNIALNYLSDPEHGIYATNLKDGVNILGVNEAIKKIVFPHMEISAVNLQSSEDFVKNIETYFQKNINLTEKQDVVIDMLNSVFYEQTIWTKFLLCISAIELLVPPRKKIGISQRCQKYIETNFGKQVALKFKKMYKTRSDIAHGTFHMKQGHPHVMPAFVLAKAILYKQLGLTIPENLIKLL